MGQVAMRSARRVSGLVEIEIPVSGVDDIVDIGGGQVRVTYYLNRPMPGGGLERVLLPHAHIMSAGAIPDAIGKGLLAIGRKIIAREDGLTVTH